jgi:hypothetical protein
MAQDSCEAGKGKKEKGKKDGRLRHAIGMRQGSEQALDLPFSIFPFPFS